jgi:hypothetical protein
VAPQCGTGGDPLPEDTSSQVMGFPPEGRTRGTANRGNDARFGCVDISIQDEIKEIQI